MATVYRSHHVDTPQRRAALKVLHGEASELSDRLARFRRESRLLRRLDHPHIVKVLDQGQSPSPWLALELVAGRALPIARPGQRPADEVLSLGVQVADALVHAHRLGVFHRDVKPSNILIDEEGSAWLVDFGIAMAVDESRITAPGSLTPGTLAYAPPEWFSDTEPQLPARGDGYGLGVVLWEQLTGQMGFAPTGGPAPTLSALFERKRQVAHLDPGEAVGGVLREVVIGLTRADPGARLSLEDALEQLSWARAEQLDEDVLEPILALDEGRLPEPGDAFVGRQAELQEARARLRSGVRLLSLVGLGGTGKTRLALRVAEETRGLWSAVVFCDLSGARDLDDIEHALGRALGVPLVAGDATAQLSRVLSARGRILLVLDNLEQVIEAARGVVGRWLVEAGELTLLTTSRVRLQIAGERVLEVGPLPLPAPGAPLEQIVASEAVQLLVQRIQEADAGFALTEVNVGAVASLVRAVDGLPLALELAAVHPRPLAGGDPMGEGGSARGTLHVALGWSWSLLGPPERRILAQCTVFEGLFSLDAAEAVLDAPPGVQILDVLQQLVDRSLLQVRRREGGFSMLRTVRAFAQERLASGGESGDALRRRHAVWCASLASSKPCRTSPPPETVVDNARAAVSWALLRGEARLALRVGVVVAEAAHHYGPLSSTCGLLEEVLQLGGTGLEQARLRVLVARMRSRMMQPEGRRHAGLALRELQVVTDPAWRGYLLTVIARVGWRHRAPEETLALVDEGIALLRASGQRQPLADALSLRVNVQWWLNLSLDTVEQSLEEALALLEAEPEPYLLGVVLGVRAMVLGESNAHVIRMARHRGHVALALDATCMEGLRLLALGEIEHAAEMLELAQQGARRCGFVAREADSLLGLAEVARRLGDFPVAEARCRRVIALCGETEATSNPTVCNELGLIASARGDEAGARGWFERSTERADAIALPPGVVVEYLLRRALALEAQGHRALALEALDQAEVAADPIALHPRTTPGQLLAEAHRKLRT